MPNEVLIKLIGPKENLPLSQDDFKQILEVQEEIIQLYNIREKYVQHNGLNPDIFLPGHIWKDSFCFKNFQTITKKKYHIINNLRFFTYNFTGLSQLDMESCAGKEGITDLPDNVDEIVKSHLSKALPFVENFLRDINLLPQQFIVTAPRICGESGLEVGGILINHDNWATQRRINALYCSGIIEFLVGIQTRQKRPCRILEIGAGYGNLAYALSKMLGEDKTEYYIVDLPESLAFSASYLTATLRCQKQLAKPGIKLNSSSGITLIANFLLNECLSELGPFDLIINVLSLVEMAESQVDFYGGMVSQLLGTNGVFFEQNFNYVSMDHPDKDRHTDARPILKKYLPYFLLLQETLAPHKMLGEACLWSNQYIGEVYDVSDKLALKALRGT